jgi:hypothetical protein
MAAGSIRVECALRIAHLTNGFRSRVSCDKSLFRRAISNHVAGMSQGSECERLPVVVTNYFRPSPRRKFAHHVRPCRGHTPLGRHHANDRSRWSNREGLPGVVRGHSRVLSLLEILIREVREIAFGHPRKWAGRSKAVQTPAPNHSQLSAIGLASFRIRD